MDLRRSITNADGIIKDVLKVDAKTLNAKKTSFTQKVSKWRNIIIYANLNATLEARWLMESAFVS